MKNKIKYLVKYIKPIYKIYNKMGNIFLSILKLIIKKNDKLILFVSYGGKKYDDSPMFIYEMMSEDIRFKDYKLVWAFINPEEYPNIKCKIKIDTLKYFIIALSSKVWITNSSVERGLNFKPKYTLYFNTWHGTPLKKMGEDIYSKNESFKILGKNPYDFFLVQGDYGESIYSKAFGINKNNFLKIGLPRNDKLSKYSYEEKEKYRLKLGIEKGKKIILYMPTFREFKKNLNRECILIPPMDLLKWNNLLGDEYCLLFRAHYEVAKTMNILENTFIKNVTDYPYLNDLMIVSDLLISDYSSTFFDYSIMDKPMLHFVYDYEEYASKRGLYFDIRKELDGADNENDLIDIIKNIDFDEQVNKTMIFINKYVNYFGNATKKAIESIYNNIQNE